MFNATDTLFSMSFGRLMHGPDWQTEVTEHTMFDIASLSKVTGTLAGIMHLYEKGEVKLDDRVSRFVPEYANHGK